MSRYRVLFDLPFEGLWAIIVSADDEEQAKGLAEAKLRDAGWYVWKFMSALPVPE